VKQAASIANLERNCCPVFGYCLRACENEESGNTAYQGYGTEHSVTTLDKGADLLVHQLAVVHELAARDDETLPLVEVGRDHDIIDAGLVFHRQKNKPHSRPWPLPGDHAARRPYKITVPASAQLPG